mmetsp:Transcript_25386/g.58499  ORF Transcript_25386/g.58499 Transcript_25386/m.58499 type:complete len:84 (+) Transcript_25386:1333-1584(+)
MNAALPQQCLRGSGVNLQPKLFYMIHYGSNRAPNILVGGWLIQLRLQSSLDKFSECRNQLCVLAGFYGVLRFVTPLWARRALL